MSFTYRGTTSDSMFFNVTERQVYNAPAFDVNAIEVPGRSGDVLNSQQRFKNKTLVYTGFIRSSDFPGNTQWERLSRGLRNIKAWICGDAGKYHDLTDDYDPGYIRRAFVSGETAINILFDRPDGATITITFLAEPFMYEVSEPIEVPESDTASGSIATFEGVDAPLKSLKFSIAPSQDLHGYSYPWPAGGGKNKFEAKNVGRENNGVTYALESDGKIKLTGTASATSYLYASPTYDQLTLIPAGSYVLSGAISANIRLVASSYTVGAAPSYTVTKIADIATDLGSGATFTLASDTYVGVNFRIQSGQQTGVTVGIQIESGSQPTSWTPYANICPISGWSEADVTRTGANVWDEVWELGGLATSTGQPYASTLSLRSKNFFSVKPGATYYIVQPARVTGVYYYKADGTFISYDLPPVTFTTPQDCMKMKLGFQGSYGTTYHNDISINYPSTDHVYHAYAGDTYPIPLGQTVYGGTVDALAGKCYARPYYASYSGQALVGPWISSHDKYAAGGTPTTGAQVVDMGGTETTISLTPVSGLTSLLGQNNIWCNTGETEVGYIVPTENPTQWPSQPRLEITMSGAGTLTVNGKTWSIGAYTGTLICDSEIMDWYDAGALKNSLVSGDGFPELVPGDNVITYTGGITKVVATPRWRTL